MAPFAVTRSPLQTLGVACVVVIASRTLFVNLQFERRSQPPTTEYTHRNLRAILRPTFHIFAYGDSLTNGNNENDRGFDYCPYATTLEELLDVEDELSEFNNNHYTFQLEHLGVASMSATKLSKYPDSKNGLLTQLQSRSNLDLIILMAGTNDLYRLARATANHMHPEDADEVTTNLLALHEMAIQNGVTHTIAVGVPPSRISDSVPAVARVTEEINQNLERHAAQEDTMTYVPFPIEFDMESSEWSADGIHLSCHGYAELGQALVEPVLGVFFPHEDSQ